MATIEQVLQEWKEEAKISETELIKELIRTPMLHSKFLDYYMYFRAKLAATEKKRNKLMWQKRKYFRGEMDKTELAQYGWSQWNGLKPSSSELNSLFDMDSDLNDLGELIQAYKSSVTSCEMIMKAIQSRDWGIKSIIEYQKWQSGS